MHLGLISVVIVFSVSVGKCTSPYLFGVRFQCAALAAQLFLLLGLESPCVLSEPGCVLSLHLTALLLVLFLKSFKLTVIVLLLALQQDKHSSETEVINGQATVFLVLILVVMNNYTY